jgi:inhibitor of cysteine peptidase
MKVTWLAAGSVVIAILMLTACSSLPNQVSVDESSSGKQVNVVVNGTITVTLDSNATTGYSWEIKDIQEVSGQMILQKIDNKYVAPTGGAIGAGGKEVWTFKALAAGTSTLTMDYSQPWAGGQKGARIFTLTVVSKYATK